MTPTGKCFICKQDILIVAMYGRTQSLEPNPDRNGNVEIRRGGGGWWGRWIGKGTPPTSGYQKHATHDCAGPEAA